MVSAWRAFLHVSERGSFTVGAAAARIPQSVASRRIAALEKQLGAMLLDRSGHGVTLTAFGRVMVPSAERLVRLVDAMKHEAETARLGPVRVAVPDICSTRDLGQLVAAASSAGINVELQPGPPTARAELVRLLQVEAALTVVPEEAGRWSTPLGVAGRTPGDRSALYLETLRPGRGDQGRRVRIWVQAEDDIPNVADRVRRLGDATGLAPSQIGVAASLVTATGAVLSSADLLVCSPRQAEDLRLHWRPLGEIALTRNYTVVGPPGLRHQFLTTLQAAVSQCLGADPVRGGAV